MRYAGAYTLRARVLFLIAVAFVPAYVVLLYFAYEQTRLARVTADAHAIELVSSISVESERLEGATHLLLGSLAALASSDSVPPHCTALASSLLVAHPQYLAVGAVSADGAIHCFAMSPAAEAAPATAEEVRTTLQAEREPTPSPSGLAYGGIRSLGGGAVPVEVFRVAVQPGARSRPVLVALLDLRWIRGFLTQVRVGTERSLTALDRDGRVVMRMGASVRDRLAPAGSNPPVIPLQPGDTARIVTIPAANGEPRRFAAAPLRRDTMAGTLLLGISDDPLLVAAERAYDRTVVVLAVVGGLVLGAGLLGGSVLVRRPMQQLLAATRRIAAGDLNTRIGALSEMGEIGQLAAAFDEMMGSLAEERRRVEQARREAEQASQSKSDFLAVMSHELKTPLASIISFAELLESGVGGSVTEEQREHLNRITESGWHLSELVNEILEFSRLESGKDLVRSEQTDVAALLADMASMIAPSAARRSLGLEVELPGEPVLIETDPSKLRQIVLNLISNAIKFTDEGEITVSLEADTLFVRIAVADTGFGIAPEHRELVFEPFWQAEAALTRTRGGAGLGLSIVDQLTRLLGGRVEVESELGKGSRFVVILPRLTRSDSPPTLS